LINPPIIFHMNSTFNVFLLMLLWF